MTRMPSNQILDLNVQGYVTAYVDLLGLSNKLFDLDLLEKVESQDDAEQIIGRAFMPITATRTAFEKFYRGHESASDKQLDVSKLPTDLLSVWNESQKRSAVIHWFSDCVTVSIPIGNESIVTTMRGISTLFAALASVFIRILACKQPVRGGIAMGYGAEISKGEIVGSCLARAYSVEQSATYPRIVIEDALEQYVTEHAAAKPANAREQVAKTLALHALKFTVRDVDNKLCIDPKSEPLLKIFDKTHCLYLLYKIFSFIESSIQIANEKQDKKMLQKYEWLRKWIIASDLSWLF